MPQTRGRSRTGLHGREKTHGATRKARKKIKRGLSKASLGLSSTYVWSTKKKAGIYFTRMVLALVFLTTGILLTLQFTVPHINPFGEAGSNDGGGGGGGGGGENNPIISLRNVAPTNPAHTGIGNGDGEVDEEVERILLFCACQNDVKFIRSVLIDGEVQVRVEPSRDIRRPTPILPPPYVRLLLLTPPPLSLVGRYRS